jgi:DNA polymerase elongation subunit (family B)
MTYISTATSKDKKNVYVWERTENGRHIVTYDAPYEYFVDDPTNKNSKYRTINGGTVSKVEYEDPFEFFKERKRLRENGTKLYESDISPELKILSERYYNKPIGNLHITFYDIEVDYSPEKGHAGSTNPYAPISSIALYHKHTDRSVVLAVPPSTGDWKNCKIEDIEHLTEHAEIYLFDNEKDLLAAFIKEIEDTDIISAWNGDFFDDPYIYFRLMKKFGKKATRYMNFPEIDADVGVREVEQYNQTEINVNPVGRVWIDYMEVVKTFDANKRDSYALEMVAEEELDDMEKLNFNKSLYRLYHEDFDKFIKYNIRDTEILKGLDNKFKYMNLAINFSHMVTNKIPAVLGTVSTSDTAILNYCKYEMNHRVVLPDAPYDVDENTKKFEGAFVLHPNVGLHEWIASLDIKSLYPSTMRSLNMSPETLIGQFFESEQAYNGIMAKSDDEFTILYENTMDETMTGKEWYEYLNAQKWSISTHGTIFDQKKDGIVPTILTNWFDERVKYQKLKAESGKKYEETNDQKYEKEAEYYDNIQYLKKIQLNSLYGVFGNKYFRFHDVRMAESTTKSGRSVLMHMVKKIAEVLDGEYKYPSESVLYGDTDSVAKNSYIKINGQEETIEKWFENLSNKHGTYVDGKKEIIKYNNDILMSPCYDPEVDEIIEKDILTIYRHKVKKPLYEIELENGKTVTITEDHSLVVERDGEFMTIKPTELVEEDIFITLGQHN